MSKTNSESVILRQYMSHICQPTYQGQPGETVRVPHGQITTDTRLRQPGSGEFLPSLSAPAASLMPFCPLLIKLVASLAPTSRPTSTLFTCSHHLTTLALHAAEKAGVGGQCSNWVAGHCATCVASAALMLIEPSPSSATLPSLLFDHLEWVRDVPRTIWQDPTEVARDSRFIDSKLRIR